MKTTHNNQVFSRISKSVMAGAGVAALALTAAACGGSSSSSGATTTTGGAAATTAGAAATTAGSSATTAPGTAESSSSSDAVTIDDAPQGEQMKPDANGVYKAPNGEFTVKVPKDWPTPDTFENPTTLVFNFPNETQSVSGPTFTVIGAKATAPDLDTWIKETKTLMQTVEAPSGSTPATTAAGDGAQISGSSTPPVEVKITDQGKMKGADGQEMAFVEAETSDGDKIMIVGLIKDGKLVEADYLAPKEVYAKNIEAVKEVFKTVNVG